jgi:hypothetical protein
MISSLCWLQGTEAYVLVTAPAHSTIGWRSGTRIPARLPPFGELIEQY